MNPDAYLSALALRSGKLFADLPDDCRSDPDYDDCETPTVARRYGTTTTATNDGYCYGPTQPLFLPREHYGYRASVLRYRPLAYRSRYDARATVSLAAFDREAPVVIDYANKLPIICLNVRRFAYTVEAFRFKRYRCVSGSAALSDPQIASSWQDSTWPWPSSSSSSSSATTADRASANAATADDAQRADETRNEIARDALQFMVSTDITRVAAWCEETYANTGQRPGANERFSELLHLTRSTGYEEYLFALARLLGTHVDLIKCRGQPADPIDGKPLQARGAVVARAPCQGYDPTFDEAADEPVHGPNLDADPYEDETALACRGAAGCAAKRKRFHQRPVDADTLSRATLGVPPAPVGDGGSSGGNDRVSSAVAALNEAVEQRSLSRQRPRFFVRYVRATGARPQNETLSDGERRLTGLPRSFALTDPSNGDGVLTAIVDGDQWHVRATRTPIVRLVS